jgi:hypothetical protein
MSSGSDNSHFGYANVTPNSNINGSFVNKYNSNYSGNFGSNEIPTSSLPSAKNNIDAANGVIPGLCLFKGGKGKRKTSKRKRKTNKRKTNKRKTNKRKTNKRKTSKKH